MSSKRELSMGQLNEIYSGHTSAAASHATRQSRCSAAIKASVHGVIALLGATAAIADPYPLSPILGGITWNEGSKQRYTTHADLWDSAWASDDNVYAWWGDGFGFSGQHKAQMGLSQLSGSPADGGLIGLDVFYGMENPPECPGNSPPILGGKPTGTLALANSLIYSLHSSGADLGGGNCASQWLARSLDNGAFWTDHIGNVEWPDANGFAPSAVLQYGRAQAGALAPDRTAIPYVYLYGTKSSQPVYEQYLARVPAVPSNSIELSSNWQYYAGADSHGNPLWNASSALARPVWVDTNNGQWLSVTFDKAIGRYLAYNDHGSACGGQPCERQVSLFDAPSPWGPWTTFDYEEEFDNVGCGSNCLGNSVEVSWFMMQKWFSPDGLTLWPEYSSTGTYDTLNLIEGTMRLAASSTVKGLAISTGTPAVLDKVSLENPGNLEYIDRTYRLTQVPSRYLGLEMIRLANNDKWASVSNYVTFTSTVAQNLCLAWDPGNPVPAWLSSWTRTGDKLVGNATFEVYRKAIPAGTVHVPGSAANDNYLLLVGC